ncbi:MAG: hypothetical protein L0211_09055 [Planctomycetaceae bacterium]|nr:hypothetical protein [Planctomycetaceae bacterium]
MTAKQILRVAYLVVALAALAWIGIGGAVWSVWRKHQSAAAASAIAGPAAAVTPPPQLIESFDRARSSVQYERLDADADEAAVPAWLARQIGPISANARSMAGWVGLLRQEGVQICWIAAPRKPSDPDFTFALPFERASVREVLDELCRCDARYRWEWMQGSEIVNLLGDEQLEVPLGDVSFRPKRLYYCVPDLAPHVAFHIFGPLDPPRNYGNLLYWPVEIKAREITVRDYLNLAVAQYEDMTWSVQRLNLVTLDAPQATRDAVAEKYRDEIQP